VSAWCRTDRCSDGLPTGLTGNSLDVKDERGCVTTEEQRRMLQKVASSKDRLKSADSRSRADRKVP
jgi:hypothetical protein